MGKAACKSANGFHSLGLEELSLEFFFFFLGLFALGDVAIHSHHTLYFTVRITQEGRGK